MAVSGERVPSGWALFGRVGTLLCGRWRWTSTLRCLWGASRPLWLSGPLRGRPTPSRSPVRSPGHPGLTKALHHPHTPLVLVYYTKTRTFFISFFCKTSRRCWITHLLQNSPFFVKDLCGVLSFAFIANKDTALHWYDTRMLYFLLEVMENLMCSRSLRLSRKYWQLALLKGWIAIKRAASFPWMCFFSMLLSYFRHKVFLR